MTLLTSDEIASMRADLAGTQLDHVCTVQRRTAGAVDPNNNPTYTWSTHLDGVACHYWRADEKELTGVNSAVVSRQRIVFAANTDITDQDRILSVTDNDGDELVQGPPLDVEEVLQRINDVLVTLRGVE